MDLLKRDAALFAFGAAVMALFAAGVTWCGAS